MLKLSVPAIRAEPRLFTATQQRRGRSAAGTGSGWCGGTEKVTRRFARPGSCPDSVSAPCRANDPQCLLKAGVALVFIRLGEAEQAELLGRAAAAESDRHSPSRQQVRDRHLLGDVERMVQVETDDRGAQADALGLTGQVQREEQGRGQVPVVRMGVMLGKPGVLHAKLIGQPDQVRHFVKDRRRRLVSRSFKMVGQPDLETGPRFTTVPSRNVLNDP